MPLVTPIFVSSGESVWGFIGYLGGREQQRGSELQKTGSTDCVCVFYHHTSWSISHQHPLSHIFRDSAAAFSKHKRKGLKKSRLLAVQFHSKHNCLTSDPGEHTSPLPLTPWLCLISLWTATVLAKAFAQCCQQISRWYRSRSGRVRKNCWISTDGTAPREASEAWNTSPNCHWCYYFYCYDDVISWGLLIILCSTLGFFIQWKCNIRKKIYIYFIFSKHSKQISVEINATV